MPAADTGASRDGARPSVSLLLSALPPRRPVLPPPARSPQPATPAPSDGHRDPADGHRAPDDGRPAPSDGRLAPGGPGFRRMNLALFLAGVATFALLYSTQALLPLVSAGFSTSESTASWTVSAATGGLALCVLPLSALSERWGRRTMMTASLAVAVTVGLLVPFAPDIGVLIALRAVQGAALAGLPASAMAYLAEEVTPGALVSAVGLFVAGNSLGGMSGRIISGWLAQVWGWRLAVGVIGVLAVGCAVLFCVLLPAQRAPGADAAPGAPGAQAAGAPRALVRAVRAHLGNPLLLRLYAIGALFMTVFGASYTVVAYRLSAAPYSLGQGFIGSVFVVYLVGTVSSARAGRLVARFGRRGALYLAAGTTAAGLLLTLATPLPAVLLGLVLITGGFFAGHAVASSAVSHTATHGRAQASALYQSGYYVGSSAGSALGALAFRACGWGGTVTLGLLAVAGVVAITLLGTRAAGRTAGA